MVKILHNFMITFREYIEILEADSPAPLGGSASTPPPTGGPSPSAGSIPPPSGGGMAAPMPGGMGGPPPSLGGGGPPMGDPTIGGSQGGTGSAASNKLKAYNVWDVLEKLLSTT